MNGPTDQNGPAAPLSTTGQATGLLTTSCTPKLCTAVRSGPPGEKSNGGKEGGRVREGEGGRVDGGGVREGGGGREGEGA